MLRFTDDRKSPFYFPPYPSDAGVSGDELNELRELQEQRDNDYTPSTAPNRQRAALSRFIQLRPPPLFSVYNLTREQPDLKKLEDQCRLDTPPVVSKFSELARLFEDETPGLFHRHALNCLLRGRDWSPPRQAFVWMALDVTLYSALQAAWYYKWRSQRPLTRFRQRPIEDPRAAGLGLTVLFDNKIGDNGTEPGTLRPDPQPSPGSPRHPAYPSGHSTYGAAASTLLRYFFRRPDERKELANLADNAGIARLIAGIHWRSDHTAGARLGYAVARMVIAQIEANGIDRLPAALPLSPSMKPCEQAYKDAVDQSEEQFKSACASAAAPTPTFDEEPDDTTPFDLIEPLSNPQRGAR
ncbi:MAG TPA: phosphatase PAP2 family protein [Tepidisphaeraceae bacterium]